MNNKHDLTFIRLSAKLALEKGMISPERYQQMMNELDAEEKRQKDAYQKLLKDAESAIQKELLIS